MARLFFLLMLLSAFRAVSQVDPEKLTAGRVEPGKWTKMEKSIRKAIDKDSLDAEARYLLSLFYFNSENSTYNIESAFTNVLKAISHYRKAIPQVREKLRKVPLDSVILTNLELRIDSAAFETAKKTNSVEAYAYFLSRHPQALQVNSAIELRDEVAFLEALKVNTWSSFQKFISQYPESHRREEASTRYEKLLYDDKTKDQQLGSYIKFHQQYPTSPYHPLAERNIFELSTVSGSPRSFLWFIQHYPGIWTKRATNILYHLRETEGNEIFNSAWLTDSLKRVDLLNRYYWLPIYKSGMFGFMDEKGTEEIVPQFESLYEDYRCGQITDRYLVTTKGLLARNGVWMWKGNVTGAEDLGSGYIKMKTDSGMTVLHESGFTLDTSGAGEAKMLGGRFIALEKNGKWAIRSLAGKELYTFLFEDLDSFDSLIVLTRNGKKIITTPARLSRDALRKEIVENLVFDELKRWGSQQYWVRNGLMEGVLDARLNFLIPLDRQNLKKTSFGFLREKDKKLYVEGIPRLANKPYLSVTEQGGWVRMQIRKGLWSLYEKIFDQLMQGDSAWFQGQVAFLSSEDSVSAILPSGQKISFFEKSQFRLLEKDSSTWIVVDDKKKKAVLDAASGVKLFSLEFDQVEPVGQKLFIITRSGKKGLVTEEGKLLVPVEYDAIVSSGEHSFSILKERKFGWYDSRSHHLMKPQFDRNIKPYNQQFSLAFKDRGYAFIRPDGTPLGNFEWEDYQYWNDSVAWVKKNFQWMLLTIRTQKTKLDRIKSFTPVLDAPAEKIYQVRQDNAMGVISNRRGIIVPLQYSDIVNLGSTEVPLYFTERHIEEAGISVVVYFDHQGKVIRKQAMESDEFEKIYCDN